MLNRRKKKFLKQLSIVALTGTIVLISIFLFWEFKSLAVSADSNALRGIISSPRQAAARDVRKQYKVFHIMSYHSPWEWTDRQFEGFKAALGDMDVEYSVMQMDTKRKSGEKWKQEKAEEIRKAVDAFGPDLIFANDDDAQRYVAKYYVNSEIPIVFSAVNADPAEYGFADAKNVTGVLEKLHYVPTVRLLEKLVPRVKKVAVISDTGTMWPAMMEEMKRQQDQFPDIEVVSYDVIPTFEEFKLKVLGYQNKADAIGFFGVFEFRDENGENVPMENVLKWLQEYSSLPDFSFWEDRVFKGTLCSVAVSAYEQGYRAGVYACDILLGTKSPAELPMTATERGVPLINMETAKRLGIEPSDDTLKLVKTMEEIALK